MRQKKKKNLINQKVYNVTRIIVKKDYDISYNQYPQRKKTDYQTLKYIYNIFNIKIYRYMKYIF